MLIAVCALLFWEEQRTSERLGLFAYSSLVRPRATLAACYVELEQDETGCPLLGAHEARSRQGLGSHAGERAEAEQVCLRSQVRSFVTALPILASSERTITQLGVRSVVEVPSQVFATVADRYYDASRWPQRIGAGTSWVPGPFEVPRELLAPPVKRWPPVTIGHTAQTSRESKQEQQQRAPAATRQPMADEVLPSLPQIAKKSSPTSVKERRAWRQVPPNSPSTPRRGKELDSGRSTVLPRPPLA